MTPPRRRAGPVERAARADVKALPAEYAHCGIAAGYLLLARRLDAGVSARDAAQLAREMRLALLTLHELAPASSPGSEVDEVRRKREDRLAKLAAAST